MQFFSSAILLGSVALQSAFAWPNLSQPGSTQGQILRQYVEDFIQSESSIALEQLLCNIGADGCHASGVNYGLVIASPSREEPPYFYTWTRDSALVFKSLVDRFRHSYDTGLQRHIMEYIAAQAHLQGISNPSGGLSDGSGLAEPKFNVDGSAFTENWGRPQRDGPALRAIAIMAYGEWLIENSYVDTAREIIWPIVRNDLSYVTQYWNHTGFDLWEEVEGSSFFTVASQHKALVQGYQFAKGISEDGSSYETTALSVLCFLQDFWVSSGGFINANINTDDGRTGLDANTVLASIHTLDTSLGCDSATFQPCSDKALSNLKAVVDSFRFYNINAGIPNGTAIAVGRYAEDVYYGGNPWYLNTLAVAEQLYDAIFVWQQQGSITVTEISHQFFLDLVPDLPVGTYKNGYETFSSIVEAVSVYADGFVNVVATYTPDDGSLDEQFSKDDGTPLSAVDLTWSYASFLTAMARRGGIMPQPWADSVEPVPGTCSAVTVEGSYTSATETIFPPSQTPVTGTPPPTTTADLKPPTTTTDCAIASEVTVTFEVRAATSPCQTIKIVGSLDELGGWAPESGIALDASDYNDDDPLWKVAAFLPAGEAVEYKYVNVHADGSVNWEADPNRSYRVPRSCETTATRSDTWHG